MERNCAEAFGYGGSLESSNLKLSKALLEFLTKNKIETLVVSSGSRNAPLVFTLQGCGAFQLFHHHDERAAAFFALGLSMKERKPVAVVCTSGTAVAEMLPATIEAYYQKLPLILISADRPAEFRGTGAPQSIDQVGIFSHYAKTFDIQNVTDFPATLSYPLHLNICLEEPQVGDWETTHKGEGPRLSPEDQMLRSSRLNLGSSPPLEELQRIEDFVSSGEILVVVGSLSPEEGRDVSVFLEKLGAPVLADTTANLEETSLILRCGERLLRTWKPEKVLRLGSVPSFRFWRDLEKLSIEVLSLSTQGFSGLARSSRAHRADNYSFLASLNIETRMLEKVFSEDSRLCEKLETLLKRYPQSELGYLRKLREYIPKEALLYLGNSLPLREWNLVNGQHRPSFANRGANGIDGQLSTFLGLADSAAESWAIVGDQTALYDMNALAIANQKSQKPFSSKRRIVIINNGGGKIFSHLSYSKHLEMPQRKILENHHRWEFRGWAEMFGWAYENWQVDSCLLNSQIDDLVLEIFPDAAQTHHFWTEWRSS